MRRVLVALLFLACAPACATGALNVLLGGGLLPLTASASPTTLSSSAASVPITTASTTCTGAGGIKPYTYAWTFGSGGSGITINSPSSATTTFTASPAGLVTDSGTAQCVVTDAGSRASGAADVSVSIENTNIFGPATLVAGAWTATDTFYGYSSLGGSLSPSTDGHGATVTALYDNETSPQLTLAITTSGGTDPGASYFTTLTINGTNYSSSSASTSYLGSGEREWLWSGNYGFVSGNSYTVTYR